MIVGDQLRRGHWPRGFPVGRHYLWRGRLLFFFGWTLWRGRMEDGNTGIMFSWNYFSNDKYMLFCIIFLKFKINIKKYVGVLKFKINQIYWLIILSFLFIISTGTIVARQNNCYVSCPHVGPILAFLEEEKKKTLYVLHLIIRQLTLRPKITRVHSGQTKKKTWAWISTNV